MRSQNIVLLWLAMFSIFPLHLFAQDDIPSVDLVAPKKAADFVPGELIVKLRKTPTGSPQAQIEAFEATAFPGKAEPIGGGAFLLKLDEQLFQPESDLNLMERTEKVAKALADRPDMKSAKADTPGKVIVKPKDATAFLKATKAKAFETIAFIGTPKKLANGQFSLQLDPQLLSPQSSLDLRARTLKALEEIKQRPDVEYVQLNYRAKYQAKIPTDPRFPKQWNFFNNGATKDQSPGGINLPDAWDSGQGNPDIVVAIIDTGILPDHEDIKGSPNLLPGFDFITDDKAANESGTSESGRDPNPVDEGDGVAAGECGVGEPAEPSSWHGSHVAGIVGAGNTNNNIDIAGVNWHVRVLPIRVLGKCGGDNKDINAAIRWAAGITVPGVPDNPTPARVINLSLGFETPCSKAPDTQSAITAAHNKGVVIVAAAGNSAEDARDFTPASCEHVIAVAASDARGRLASRYSNFGPRIDIMAPGGDVQRDDDGDGIPDGILSFVKGGLARYNGTSMAAPHVSGVVALILARNPSLIPDQVLDQLKRNAMPRTTTQCPQACGAGLLNALFPNSATPAPAAAPATATNHP